MAGQNHRKTRYHFHVPRYVANSAGIRAVHYLTELLRGGGHEVTVTNPKRFGWGAPRAAADAVAVYPDCIGPSNPLQAKCVVRFMFAPPSWPRPYFFGGGPTGGRIAADDLVVIYDNWYRNDVAWHYEGELRADCVLPVPCIERGLFAPESKTIDRVIYTGKTDFGIRWDAVPVITRTSHSRAEAARMLCQAKRFYTLDHYTMMAHEAALCGCRVYRLFPNGESVPYPLNETDYEQGSGRDQDCARRFDEMVRGHFE